MDESADGATRPVVDASRCVDCGLCRKVCPNNSDVEYKRPIACHAAWITDKAKRRVCASGGVGTVLSETMLDSGGCVFGSRYDDYLVPIMAQAKDKEDLERFKGSRYVQSLISSDTYKQAKVLLGSGEKVLFIGTPCQISGLKCYLRKPYANLITVDLICHGVSPTRYLVDEVNYLSRKYGLKGLADIRFRGNDGNNYRQKLLRLCEAQQYYITGFLLGVSMRENCYSCRYARPDRVSDITIGDFIGLGTTAPFNHPTANVSSVLINTPAGMEFYEAAASKHPELVSIERTYEERLQYAPSLLHPFNRHPLNAKFKAEYSKYGYALAIRRTLGNYMRRNLLRRYLSFVKRVVTMPLQAIKNGRTPHGKIDKNQNEPHKGCHN